MDCLAIAPNGAEPELRTRFRVPADNVDQPLFVSGALKQTQRVMLKDENVCLHCGLCAERCPTYAWDMRKFVLQLPYAGGAANGSSLRADGSGWLKGTPAYGVTRP